MHGQVGNVDFPMFGFGIFPESRQVNETWKFKSSCFHVFCFFFIRPHRGYQQQKDLSTDILVFEGMVIKDRKFRPAINGDFRRTGKFFISRSTLHRSFSLLPFPVHQRQANTKPFVGGCAVIHDRPMFQDPVRRKTTGDKDKQFLFRTSHSTKCDFRLPVCVTAVKNERLRKARFSCRQSRSKKVDTHF